MFVPQGLPFTRQLPPPSATHLPVPASSQLPLQHSASNVHACAGVSALHCAGAHLPPMHDFVQHSPALAQLAPPTEQLPASVDASTVDASFPASPELPASPASLAPESPASPASPASPLVEPLLEAPLDPPLDPPLEPPLDPPELVVDPLLDPDPLALLEPAPPSPELAVSSSPQPENTRSPTPTPTTRASTRHEALRMMRGEYRKIRAGRAPGTHGPTFGNVDTGPDAT